MDPEQNYKLFMIFFVPLSTGIVVSIFGLWASNRARQYYEGWRKYNELRDKTENDFKVLTTQQYTCLKQSIEQLKNSKADRDALEKEAKALRESLDKEALDIRTKLDKRADGIWERVNNHEHSIHCEGTDCTATQTNGVITNPKH